MKKTKTVHSVSLPTKTRVIKQLLLALNLRSKPTEPTEIYVSLADHFGLTALERHAFMPNSEENAWHNRVRQARRDLVNLGFIDNSQRGLWSLTATGRAEARKREREKDLRLEDLDE